MGLNKGGVVSKYIIAVVFLLGLMQGKTEALGLENEINRISDELLIIRELAVVSKKYTKCTITKDDKKRLACFDSLTIYMKQREKIYENLIRLDKLEVGSKKESEERLKNIIKNLDKALDLKK